MVGQRVSGGGEGAIKPHLILPDIIQHLWRHEMQPPCISVVARLQDAEESDCPAEGARDAVECFVWSRMT